MAEQLSEDIKLALNTIGENIFVADAAFQIVWINDYADALIEKLKPFIHVERKEDLVGQNIRHFHRNGGEHQRKILANGPFPYVSRINLFNRYWANIVINPIIKEAMPKWYVLTWKDITEQEEEREEREHLIESMESPVIEIMPNHALLVPIVGIVNKKRMDHMMEKILEECSHSKTEYLIIDFTGLENTSGGVIKQLEDVTRSVRLMGIEVIFTGIPIHLVKEMVKADITIEVKSLNRFAHAIEYIKNRP